MKKQQKWLGLILGVVASLVISSTSMAAEVPPENRLPTWGDSGSETIDFTNIAVNYIHGKKKKGIVGDTVFFGESTDTSVFNLNGGAYGGASDPTSLFDGYMAIDANISSRGRLLQETSSFGIYSTDARFDNGLGTVAYDCNKGGNSCTEGWLVYGGTITDFGWSSSEGILEFTISNLSGWALDEWTTGAAFADHTEHLMLNVHGGSFDLGGVSSVKAFTAMADGFAVVPVPAAVWLFGSGLIGLVGVARRKRA